MGMAENKAIIEWKEGERDILYSVICGRCGSEFGNGYGDRTLKNVRDAYLEHHEKCKSADPYIWKPAPGRPSNLCPHEDCLLEAGHAPPHWDMAAQRKWECDEANPCEDCRRKSAHESSTVPSANT